MDILAWPRDKYARPAEKYDQRRDQACLNDLHLARRCLHTQQKVDVPLRPLLYESESQVREHLSSFFVVKKSFLQL